LQKKRKSQKLKQVLLAGKLENPLIQCAKAMDDSNHNCQVIPLAIKKQGGQQKFRIPFKNVSEKADADVDFSFVRIQKRADEGEEKSILNYLEFFCQPATLKLNGGQQSLLNVLVKVDYAKMTAELTEKEIKRESEKLLIGKVKDTGLFFDFFVSLKMVDLS